MAQQQESDDDISASRIRSIIRPFYAGLSMDGTTDIGSGGELEYASDNVMVVSDFHKSRNKSRADESYIESEFFSTLSVMDQIRLHREEEKERNNSNSIADGYV